jgi:hypothetical protein
MTAFALTADHDGPPPPIGNPEGIERKRPIDYFVIVYWDRPSETGIGGVNTG